MDTGKFIEALRSDIKRELKAEILAELQPLFQKQLYSNIFTFEEGMLYLKSSESTLRRRVKDGDVPYFRQRGRIYFRQIDLDKYIAEAVKSSKDGRSNRG